MTPEKRRKLSACVRFLKGMLPIFEREPHNIEGAPVNTLTTFLGKLETDFPGLAPQFNPYDYLSHEYDGGAYYKSQGVRAHILAVIPILEEELNEDGSEPTPVTEHREFKFISDAKLRGVIERDYAELQVAFVAQCYKSAIILSGGAIETILLDQVKAQAAKALASSAAPKGKSDIERWGLADLIAVAVDLGIVPPGVEKLSHSVREYRNLVHPAVEVRSGLTVDREEASIAIQVLHIIHRELS